MFIIINVCGPKGTVGIDGKIMIVIGSAHQGVCQDSIGIRIGGIKLPDNRSNRLIFQDGKGRNCTQMHR